MSLVSKFGGSIAKKIGASATALAGAFLLGLGFPEDTVTAFNVGVEPIISGLILIGFSVGLNLVSSSFFQKITFGLFKKSE